MKTKIYLGAMAILALSFYSCKKSSSSDTPTVSVPQFQVGEAVKGDTLSGSVKGTLLAGKTYYFSTPVTINAGDTLVMQNGVKLLATAPAAQLLVNGAFVSLGTQASPNYITGIQADQNPSQWKLTTLINANEDPALGSATSAKMWGGIQCATTTNLVDIKWTHLDFAGGVNGSTPLPGYSAGDALFVILFQNPDGYLILEDSWVYGSTTDAIRIQGGKVHIMRNTVEKLAYNDGDAFNAKNATSGDMAFNLIMGTAKGGTKASNKGTYGPATECNINMYNNTYIAGGYRSIDPDRGANVDYEQGAEGLYYNNIAVNCRTGYRVLENPIADTAHIRNGNNFQYGDSTYIDSMFYPTTHISVPQPTDIPNPTTFYPGYPSTYTLGEAYNFPQALIGTNKPQFVNFPLPVSAPMLYYTFQGTYDFHLQSSSPCVGKGYVGFSPVNSCAAVTNSFLKPTVTAPNMDLGCYPTGGGGNQH